MLNASATDSGGGFSCKGAVRHGKKQLSSLGGELGRIVIIGFEGKRGRTAVLLARERTANKLGAFGALQICAKCLFCHCQSSRSTGIEGSFSNAHA